MNSAMHTPGPWVAVDEGGGDFMVASKGARVASDVCEPDAALIAAAPDLLAALRGLLAPDAEDCQAEQGHDDGIPEPCGVCAGCTARAAIARAEGR